MWVLNIVSPWEEAREHVLRVGRTMLGRHPGNDIVIADDSASRLHAEIELDLITNTVTVRDVASTNGTWVNRERITDRRPLRPNDQIHVGRHLLTLLQRDHVVGHPARLPNTQPLTRDMIRQSTDRRAPVVYEVAQRLNSLADLPTALGEVARITRAALAADGCHLILASQLEDVPEGGVPRSVLRRAVAQRAIVHVRDLAAEPQYWPGPPDMHPVLCVPGLAGEEVVSLTSVYRTGPNWQPFEDFDIQLAVAISHEVATAAQNVQLLNRAQEMIRQASTDRLTGLHTRRYFLQQAEQEFARARRYGRPAVMLMLDVDGFKAINEQHGYATGDQVLCAVARMLTASLREPHLLCRYGSDHFVVLLLECDREGAQAVAARLRQHLAAQPIDTMTGPVPIAVSLGYAALSPACPDLLAFINQAEADLYQNRPGRVPQAALA